MSEIALSEEERDALIAALSKPFDRSAIKRREGGGGKMFDYVQTHTVIHRLNDAAKRWDFHVTEVKQHGDLWIAFGELTIPGLGTRTGMGVQKMAERSGEDLIKGLASDCLKKCATLFGVALELYGPDYEDEDAPRQKAAPPAAPKANSNRPRMKISEEQQAQIKSFVPNPDTDQFKGWLSKNTANQATSLDDVLAEDVEEIIHKLDDLAAKAAKRKAAS